MVDKQTNTGNVLITSLGDKVPMLRCIQSAVNRFSAACKVVGADTRKDCLGAYFTDEFWLMPYLDDLSKEAFISECKKRNIRFVFPTRDAELLFFARNRIEFKKNAIHAMISEKNAITLCLNKWLFFKKTQQLGFPTIKTYLNRDDVPEAERKSNLWVIKPMKGAGSRHIGLKLPWEETQTYAQAFKHPIFQPFIDGKELSVDLYNNLKGQTMGVIVRERIKVVNGESQITRIVSHSTIEHLSAQLSQQLNLTGHVMFQWILKTSTDKPYLLECNARFGGASTLSVAHGLDSFYWFLKESANAPIKPNHFRPNPTPTTLIRHKFDHFY